MIAAPLRSLLAAAAALWLGGAAASAQPAFTRPDLASESIRLEDTLRREAGPLGDRQAAQLRRDAEAALARDPRRALTLAVPAVAADPKSSAGWAVYARAAKAVTPANYDERWRLEERATSAAYAAYARTNVRGEQAAALALLGDVLAWRKTWRPSLQAYRASLALADEPAVRATYEKLREQHGFRVTDYKVDSDSASPRACFTFSEPLADARTDLAPFVAVSGAANAAVTSENTQLCVEGLRHGQSYGIVLRQGLPSTVGEALLKAADYQIYVRDRSPQVRFTGRNYVLPRVGEPGIPVVSVNATAVAIDVFRIGDRNLLPTLRADEFLSQMTRETALAIAREKGFRVWSGTLATASDLNRDVVTSFPVLQAVGRLEPGIYVMTARMPGVRDEDAGGEEEYQRRATQWFVVSDLGLTALKGADGVNVFVRSLASGAPLGGIEVRLVARNNEVLASKATDAAGRVAFDPGLARGEGGLAPGLVVAQTSADYGFLDLAQGAFDLSDRGVKGRAVPAGAAATEAFLYTERGVYRSGETVHLTALLRDRAGLAASGLPLTLVVKRPDGVEHRREQVADAGLGGRAFALPLQPGAMRGTWRVAAYLDPKAPPVGDAAFLVEDYVPERLELTLAPKSPALKPGEPAAIDLSARYLFGAPGAGLEVSGEVVVGAAPASAVPGLAGYTIGIADEEVEATTAAIEDAPATGPDGRATVNAPVQRPATSRPVEAKIILRVAEPGGRAVERSLTLPVLPAGPVLGIRKTFGADLAEGATATFDVVAAAPDGTRIASGRAVWSLYRVESSYQWFNADGRWGFEPVKSTRRVADGRVELSGDAPARIATPVGWGSYRLDVASEDGSARSSLGFTVGYGGEATAETPDLLQVSLDKKEYRSGEEIRARITPRFAGRATVAVMTNGVQDTREIALPAEGATVTIPVKAEWGSGAYLVATAFRPLDGVAKRMPGRAVGVAWFGIDRDARDLRLEVATPPRAKPRAPLSVPVRLDGLAAGEEAWVTVAAVDVGILNLTRYATPDPGGHFFGQKALGVEMRDLYGYLIDGMAGAMGAIRSGGDAAPGALEGAPPAQAPLAFFSGPVRVGSDGAANVSFDLPAFNGTVRVTAVAWSRTRTGAASADVIVRDPVVVAGTLPRFLAVGDRSRLRLDLDNVEGAAGEYLVDVDIAGPVLAEAGALRQRIRLARGGKASVTLPIATAGPGDAVLDVRLTGPDLDVAQRFAIRVQPGTGPLVRRDVRPLEPGGSLTVTGDLLADILPGTGAVSVSVSPVAALDVPGLLAALDRYPYGCSEQIVSRAMPLLYVNRLAAASGGATASPMAVAALGIDGAVDERVRGAIERVLSRQGSSGSFGLWSAGGDDLWLDSYVTDFLTRARELKYPVPQAAFAQALERLRNQVANTTEVEGGNEGLAYAAYVLARNGRPVAGDLRYLADTKLASFKSPMARGQIAAALGLLGDRGRAQTAFASAVTQLRSNRDGPAGRPDYGTRLRDGAALVALSSEVGGARETVGAATRAVEEERATRTYTSTQENAWMVLAADTVLRDAAAVQLDVGGAPHRGAFHRRYGRAALDATPLRVANTGGATAQVVVSVTGNPIEPEPAANRGFGIERSYYKLDGTKVEAGSVRQNDRLVAVLKVTEPQSLQARVLVVDPLPAGFEIDNPKLVDSGSVGALDWLKRDVEPVNAEYRDDRFVAAFDREPGQPATFSIAYLVRAVTPGRYVHPAAIVEDMYRPDRFGRTSFGSVEVAAR